MKISVVYVQKPAPSLQPQYVVAAPPFSPTSIRAPLGASPFPHPQQVMMVTPQQLNVYRGKQPFNKRKFHTSKIYFFLTLKHLVKFNYQDMTHGTIVLTAARGQSYGSREQGESPPFISAAAATGSPIIAPGVGTFPQQVYQIPSHQPVAYVQSPAGMVPSPQQMMQQVGSMFFLYFQYKLSLNILSNLHKS